MTSTGAPKAEGRWRPIGRPRSTAIASVDASFWSEPVNALSNAAFLVAAAIAFARWRRAGASDLPALLLIAAVAVVGIGSFLFHTFANRWSRLADVIPIAVFIYGYFALAMHRFFGLGVASSIGITAAFLVFSFGFERAWLQRALCLRGVVARQLFLIGHGLNAAAA